MMRYREVVEGLERSDREIEEKVFEIMCSRAR